MVQPVHHKGNHVPCTKKVEKLLLNEKLQVAMPSGNISNILITSPPFNVQLSSTTNKDIEVMSNTEEDVLPSTTTDQTIPETEPSTLLPSTEITTKHEVAYETNIHHIGLTQESK